MRLETFRHVDDLKRLFHRRAHDYHPDKNPHQDASALFRELIAAYELCLDNVAELSRRFGIRPPSLQETQAARQVIENLDDIFEDIFGFSKSGRVLGYHEPQEVWLAIEEFFTGVCKTQKMIAYRKCPDCQGSGARGGAHARVCSYCFGKGTIVRQSLLARKRHICAKCRGRGRNAALFCERCDGFGRLKQYHTQEFTVPTGLKPFEIYTLEALDKETRLKTQVFVELKPLRHPVFRIEGANLLCELHQSLGDSPLGKLPLGGSPLQNCATALDLCLKTPGGEVAITIPPGVRDGQILVVKNAGLFTDVQKKSRGDLHVTIREKKRGLLERLRRFFAA